MEIVITQIDEGLRYIADLNQWARTLGDDPSDPDFDGLKYLEGDPDIMRCDGNKTYFMSVELNGTKYVLVHQEISETEKEMLEHFHHDDFKQHFSTLPSSWDAFETASNAIAYRGGSGYCYTIWNYTHTKNKAA